MQITHRIGVPRSGRFRRVLAAALGLIAVLAVFPACADPITPDRFADVTLKLLFANANLVRGGGQIADLVVVSASDRPACSTCLDGKQLADAFGRRAEPYLHDLVVKPRSVVATRCSADFLGPATGLAAIVAVDLPSDCVAKISEIARTKHILTVSTRKQDIDRDVKTALSVAVVLERNQMQVYRSDYALGKEGVRFSAEMLTLTRSSTSGDYRENYRQALRAIDFRNWPEATRRLQAAIATRPEEGGYVLIYGARDEAYLPHFQLGYVLYKQGDCRNALEQLLESSRQNFIRPNSPQYNDLQLFTRTCRQATAPVATRP